MPSRVWAIDETGGQAIVEDGDRWYRLSMDNGWRPIPLRDELDAYRCALFALYRAPQFDFQAETLQSLAASVREYCLEYLPVPCVPLARIIHLCPANVKESWGLTAAEERRDFEVVSPRRVPAALVTAEPREEFWDRVHDYAYAYAARRYPEFDAADYAATVLLELLDARSRTAREIRAEESVALLPKLMRQVARDFRRRRPSRPPMQWQFEPAPIDHILAEEEKIMLEDAIGTLSGFQQAIIRNFMAGYSTNEIADVLGCSGNTVRYAKARAFEKLRSIMEGD